MEAVLGLAAVAVCCCVWGRQHIAEMHSELCFVVVTLGRRWRVRCCYWSFTQLSWIPQLPTISLTAKQYTCVRGRTQGTSCGLSSFLTVNS